MVIDLLSPIVDGFEMLKKLRTRTLDRRRARIVVMRGLSEPFPASTLHDLCADSVLPKPFSVRQLREAVSSGG